MSTKENKGSCEEFKWTVENEISLFEAMTNHKVVGTNRFFNMALVLERLSEMNKIIPSNIVWDHVKSMYDIEALGEMETVVATTEDFLLPASDFSELMKSYSNNDDGNKNLNNRTTNKPKTDLKDSPKLAPKRDEKITKITPRRDSTFKEGVVKTNTPAKPVLKTELDKKNVVKSRSRKNSDISMSPIPTTSNRIGRSTRGSLKPEENTPNRSRSPITNVKRRTRTDLK